MTTSDLRPEPDRETMDPVMGDVVHWIDSRGFMQHAVPDVGRTKADLDKTKVTCQICVQYLDAMDGGRVPTMTRSSSSPVLEG